jgi:exodeoxyribonuclease V alpha subunit
LDSSVVSLQDCVTFLIKSRRFDGEGGIGKIAQGVISGNYEQSWALLNQQDNEEITHLKGELITWLLPLVEQYYLPIFKCENVCDAFTLFSQFRVLCATRVGEQGVDFINELITSLLINKGVIKSNQTLYSGRPIIISENNYHQGLYNGDIGFLWKNKSGHLMAVFEDNDSETGYRWIMTSKLPHFETVYAMTIHKTQGSEFFHVAMILPNQKDNRLLSRELLYTGITRAKGHISIATNARVWRQGVETQITRYSSFSNNNV